MDGASREDEPALKPEAKIGETFSQYEPWSCEYCGFGFELREAFFDAQRGVVCPQCKSPSIGRKSGVQ